jgi:uncharacterized protein YgbK (DUF1537 family)
VARAVVAQGPAALREALAAAGGRGERLVIVDAVDEADLRVIGAACDGAPLVTGGSGVALGLPDNFARDGRLRGAGTKRRAVQGPAAVLAGSCSARTLEQAEHHRRSHPAIAVPPDDVLSGTLTAEAVIAFLQAHAREAPLAYSTADPAAVASAQQRHGRERVAHAIEQFFGRVAVGLVEAGVTRLAIAGGETSGAVVSALGLRAVDIGPEIDPGVPVLFGGDVALALKSGNFGTVDFFDKALHLMERGA